MKITKLHKHMKYVRKLSKKILIVLKLYLHTLLVFCNCKGRETYTFCLIIWFKVIPIVQYHGFQQQLTTFCAKSTRWLANTTKNQFSWIQNHCPPGYLWLTVIHFRTITTMLWTFTEKFLNYSQRVQKPTCVWVWSIWDWRVNKVPFFVTKKPSKSKQMILLLGGNLGLHTINRKNINKLAMLLKKHLNALVLNLSIGCVKLFLWTWPKLIERDLNIEKQYYIWKELWVWTTQMLKLFNL